MVLRIGSVTFDCRDVGAMADFWKAALRYVEAKRTAELALVEDPKDRDIELVFLQVPEGKAVKNRVHLDLGTNDREAEVERLIGLGAERVENIQTWTVMRDVEGNEFCVCDVPATDPVENWRT